ncbi:MAG: hypothetical protein E7326_04185 [Clostridiales bacterium]|nr:hypothetical protein [Clostridiales bacterium]
MTRENVKVFLKKALALVTVCLGYAPAFALIAAFGMPKSALYAIWQCALVIPFGLLQFILQGRARAVYAPVSALLYALVIAVIMPEGTGIMGYVPLLIGCALLLITPRAAKAPIGSEWSVGLWAGGMFAGLFAQLLLRARGLAEQGQVKVVSEVLLYLYVVYIFLLLMNLNQASMDMGTVSRGKAGLSSSMVRRNRGSVVLLFMAALVASMWGTLAKWVETLWEKAMAALRFLLNLIPLRRDEGILQQEGVMSIDPGAAMAEAVEKSWFAQLMDKILLFIGYAAAAALAVFVIYFLGKKLWQLVKWLGGRFRDYVNKASEDYVDETENIFDAEEVKKLLSDKVKELFAKKPREKKPRWQELDGRSKVRYLYRCFMERHPKVSHLTAREALLSDDTISRSLTQPFADLYDKARYSDHAISEQDAEKWKQKLNY